MNLRAVCSFENRRTCDKIWVWEQRFFREESEKKGILWTFMAHQVFWFWENWRFLNKNIGMRVWGVYDKLKKKTWEHCVFNRDTRIMGGNEKTHGRTMGARPWFFKKVNGRFNLKKTMGAQWAPRPWFFIYFNGRLKTKKLMGAQWALYTAKK